LKIGIVYSTSSKELEQIVINQPLLQFPPEVITEINYYVYRLIDPRNGETFYVGKGKGNRVFHHMRCASMLEEFDDLDDKIQTIREIHSAGLEVIHVIHRHGMDEDTAFEVEAALIDAYPSSTNIMGGTGSNDFGPMNALEILNKYATPEAVISNKVVMITINKSVSQKSIYDAVRFAWKISEKRIQKIEYVLAVIQGIIVGVFKPDEWKKATVDNFPEFHSDQPNRFGFVGKEADDTVKQLYLRKRVPIEFRKKGSANPIKYNF
jgi:hypothetical protein